MKTKITPVLSLILAIVCSTASAQIYVDLDATGANDGTSWANAYTDLNSALDDTGSEIWIAEGTYTPTNTALDTFNTFAINSGISIYGGFAGTEGSIDERTGNNPVILSGDIAGDDVAGSNNNKADNIFHVVNVTATDGGVTVFDGLTISGGNTRVASNGSDLSWRGGGIYATTAIEINDVTFSDNFARGGGAVYLSPELMATNNSKITNCTFSDNSSVSQSAGILANGIDGLEVINCTFKDNNTTIRNTSISGSRAGNAGAIYFDGREDEIGESNVLFENCTFDDNANTDFGGGMMYAFRASYTMKQCTLTNNLSSNSGGAIFNTGGDAIIVIEDCYFENNTANFGGAHSNYGLNADFTIRRNTYNQNFANTSGAGLINGFEAFVKVDSCDFTGNVARFGGAISNQNDTTVVEIRNSTFTNNEVGEDNGGAINVGGPLDISIDNCLFQSNTAGIGGAINASGARDADDPGIGSLSITNCTIIENQASSQGAAINTFDMNTSITSSVIGGNINLGTGAGGGMSINAVDTIVPMTTTITNSTIADNFAEIGAGIGSFTSGSELVNSTLILVNNIFGNEGLNYEIEDGMTTVTSLGGNVVNDETLEDVLVETGDASNVDDLGFVDNLNLNYRLMPGSPAINVANPTYAPETDIVGNPRIDGPDAGAYESDVNSVIDIKENDGQLVMAPNPVATTTTITIDNSWRGPIQAKVYSIDGSTMKVQTFQKSADLSSFAMDVSRLQTGTYILLVDNGVEATSYEFVKQ